MSHVSGILNYDMTINYFKYIIALKVRKIKELIIILSMKVK